MHYPATFKIPGCYFNTQLKIHNLCASSSRLILTTLQQGSAVTRHPILHSSVATPGSSRAGILWSSQSWGCHSRSEPSSSFLKRELQAMTIPLSTCIAKTGQNIIQRDRNDKTTESNSVVLLLTWQRFHRLHEKQRQAMNLRCLSNATQFNQWKWHPEERLLSYSLPLKQTSGRKSVTLWLQLCRQSLAVTTRLTGGSS